MTPVAEAQGRLSEVTLGILHDLLGEYSIERPLGEGSLRRDRIHPLPSGHLLNACEQRSNDLRFPHAQRRNVLGCRKLAFWQPQQVPGGLNPLHMHRHAVVNRVKAPIESCTLTITKGCLAYRPDKFDIGIDQHDRINLQLTAKFQLEQLLHHPASDRTTQILDINRGNPCMRRHEGEKAHYGIHAADRLVVRRIQRLLGYDDAALPDNTFKKFNIRRWYNGIMHDRVISQPEDRAMQVTKELGIMFVAWCYDCKAHSRSLSVDRTLSTLGLTSRLAGAPFLSSRINGSQVDRRATARKAARRAGLTDLSSWFRHTATRNIRALSPRFSK